jgi:integrative and conjugative element protein (TIGR02256 family)
MLMRNQIGIAWISEAILGGMLAEAERMSPLETGGALIGYWVTAHEEAVITDVTGPGPRAIHAPYAFLPDDEFQEGEIARVYHVSGRLHTYLGDWHTHPGSSSYLSWRDKRTLRKVAISPDARAPIPLMAVFGGGPDWVLKVWKYEPTRLECFGLRVRILPLRLQVYS